MINNINRANIQGVSTVEKRFSTVGTNLPMRVLVAGYQLPSGTNTTANTPQQVTSEKEAGTLYGEGSELHRLLKATLLGTEGAVQVDAFSITEGTATAKKEDTLTITGTATSNGIITIYAGTFGTDKVQVIISSGDTQDQIATKIQSGLNENTSLPVTYTVATNTIVFTAKNSGSFSNNTIWVNPFPSEKQNAPADVSYGIATGTAGDQVTSVQTIVDFLQNTNKDWYTDVITHATTKALVKQISDVTGNPNTKTGLYNDIDYRPFSVYATSTSTTKADVIAYADESATPSLTLFSAPSFIENPQEISGYIAGIIARTANENIAQSYHKKQLVELAGPVVITDAFTQDYSVQDELYKKGVTPLTFENNIVLLGDVVASWLPSGDFDAPFKLLVNQRKTWAMAYDIKTLDNSSANLGRPIVESVGATAVSSNAIDVDTVKANVVELIGQWVNRAIIFNHSYTISNMVIAIDTVNSDRINKTIPVVLSGNNRIGQTEIQVSREVQIAITG